MARTLFDWWKGKRNNTKSGDNFEYGLERDLFGSEQPGVHLVEGVPETYIFNPSAFCDSFWDQRRLPVHISGRHSSREHPRRTETSWMPATIYTTTSWFMSCSLVLQKARKPDPSCFLKKSSQKKGLKMQAGMEAEHNKNTTEQWQATWSARVSEKKP